MAYDSNFCIARTEKEESKDINEEFVLSDYQPEVKKILTYRECISVPSVSFDGNSATAEGIVRFDLIYVGNDNNLYSAPFEYEYSFSFPGVPQNVSVSDMISVNTDAINVKALSPRRISVRGRLKMLFILQSADGEEECITESSVPSSCEALYKNVEYMRLVPCESEMFELADEMVNDISSEAPRIIYCESNAFVSDTDNVNGRIVVRGEVTTEMLVCDDSLEEIPKLMRRKTPFSHTFVESSCRESDLICAHVVPTASEARIEESGILINVCCAVKVYLISRESESVCSDIYSPLNKLTLNENSFDTYIPLACGNRNMSVNLAVLAAEAGMDPKSKIVCSFASADCEKISVSDEGSRESIAGRVTFKIITVDDSDAEKIYDCKEVTSPFKYDISRDIASSRAEGGILVANASATRTLSRFDGERVGLDTELSLSFLVLNRQKNSGIANIVLGEKIENSGEYIRIIYPANDDSLWSIAKRMSIPVASLAAKNGISADVEKASPRSLSEVKYLIL